MIPFMMTCILCGQGHRYTSPSQFSSWARRHRATKHANYDGRIEFRRKKEPRTKTWKEFGNRPPCHPRVMLSLPMESGDQHRVFMDRRTGIFWREDLFLAPTQWSWYRPPSKHRRRAE